MNSITFDAHLFSLLTYLLYFPNIFAFHWKWIATFLWLWWMYFDWLSTSTVASPIHHIFQAYWNRNSALIFVSSLSLALSFSSLFSCSFCGNQSYLFAYDFTLSIVIRHCIRSFGSVRSQILSNSIHTFNFVIPTKHCMIPLALVWIC